MTTLVEPQAAPEPRHMTVEELLALPDDGRRRWLVNGELHEETEEEAMSRRVRPHAKTQNRLSQVLGIWLDGQPEPRGEMLAGEIGFRLRRDPALVVGMDAAYISAALAAAIPANAQLIDGVPILAVEILSPSDQIAAIEATVQAYLEAGVAVVWVLNPYSRIVTVYRPGQASQARDVSGDLTGDPELTGFQVPVADLFR